MKHIFFKSALPLVGLLALTGCIDDKYDLSDVDTSTEIKVNNLVIPVKLASITLEQLLDIDEEDPDATVVTYTGDDGKTYYAIRKKGDFHADDIYIEKVYASEATVVPVPTMDFNSGSGSYTIPSISTTFTYKDVAVDPSIEKIASFILEDGDHLTVNTVFTCSKSQFTIQNLVIALPKGFVGSYNGGTPTSDGKVNVGTVSSTNGRCEVTIDVKELDLVETYPEQGGIDNPTGSIDIIDKIGVDSGTLVASGDVTLDVAFSMDAFTVAAFSGNVNYEIEEPEIEPADLSDLPDFLSNENTDVTLVNPQLYLEINNGASEYGGLCYSGLSIIPWREENASDALTIDEFLIGANNAESNTYNLVLAPNPSNVPASVAGEYPDLHSDVYENLKYILTGQGLPETLSFEMLHPVLRSPVHDFPLGTNMTYHGDYTFFSPLDFEKGSIIYYVKEENDWFEGDVDKMHVKKLHINAVASTNLKYDITLNAYPYVKDYDTGEVTIDRSNKATAPIPALSTDLPIELDFPKEIIGLDGIYFEAVFLSMEEDTLNSEQYLNLDNLKATVDGSYFTEF